MPPVGAYMTHNPAYADLLPESATIDTTAVDSTQRIPWKTIPAKKAIYLLTDANDQPLLLATVGNLRAALQRRLTDAAPDEKTRRIPFSKIAQHVHYRIVHSPFAANLWYYKAAARLFPATYQEMISWRPAWWISIDPTALFPRFRRTQNLSDPTLQYAGPIQDKNAAGKLIEALEDLFDLCRYYNILVQAPHGKACAYKEMGKCPAPCDGTVSMPHYHSQIRDALNFLIGIASQKPALPKPADSIGGTTVPTLGNLPNNPDSISSYESWRQSHESQMRAAAAQQEYERANKIKAKLERGAIIEQPQFHFIRSLSQFSFLALQPGQGRPYIEPFFIHGGHIEAGPPIHKKNLSAAVGEWYARIAELRSQPIKPPLTREATETIGLAVHHLLRGGDDAGIYLPMHAITDAQAILTAAKKLIARRTPPKPMAEQSSEQREVSAEAQD